MSDARNYNHEARDTGDHKYAYSFDFDVMHPFMMRAFAPFFRTGNVLELGSFKGDFTRRLVEIFHEVTCVEASDEAAGVARASLGEKVTIINGRFESVRLTRRFDNIMLTHVLEHLDDPVAVLKRVNDEWLTDGGRLFLACPNANAPSRQIAVKMGLITHNSAITPAEKEHGHRVTYALDTLERDARAAGLSVVHRSGIFFKALANFQWDRLMATDIISKEYLDGCYELGLVYPDLCSSIFLVCEKARAGVKLGIMQPYFLPYIGYWQLLAAVDAFVVYDNIQYTKKGWINRNRFLQNGHDELFTVPLREGSDFLDVRQRSLAEDFKRDKLLNQFEASYRKAPHFNEAFPLIASIIRDPHENLFDYIANSIRVLAGHLGITTSIVVSSTVAIDHSLRGEHKVIALCKALGAERYLNAIGGQELYTKPTFADQGIELGFVRTRPIVYGQFANDFVPNLSIVDVLMFNDRNAVRGMLGEYDLV